jgi:polyribonucleotide nucleotidyltransferase
MTMDLKEFCASCGVILRDVFFRCQKCGKLNCMECRNEIEKCCMECAPNLPAISGMASTAGLSFVSDINAITSRHIDQKSHSPTHVHVIRLNPSEVGQIIGPAGKTVYSIIDETGVKIDISSDGTIVISSEDAEAAHKAKERVQAIVREPEVGMVYNGLVRRITDFGAFVEIIPGTDGLVHISELDTKQVKRVEDFCHVGDRIEVKVISIDGDGKIRLSRKALHAS